MVVAFAKVSGIQAKSNYSAYFLFENLKSQTYVVETSWRSVVQRLLVMAHSCFYQKFAEQMT